MRRWLMIAVPLGIAAVMLSVLAIGFGAPSSHAVKPGSEPTGGEAECADRDTMRGNLSGGNSSEFGIMFCSDPEANFNVHLKWGRYKADRDLALRVTAPNGMVFFVDNDPSAAETLTVYGPLPEGSWTIEVINHGAKRVNYELTFGFG